MKLFDPLELPPKDKPYLLLADQATTLIIQICESLKMSLPALHAALWAFHCNALIMTFHRFDRFQYACGAIFVGSKLMEHLVSPIRILEACRRRLREKKNLEEDEDSEEYLKREVKKIFEAEVNIMINIGFDFDISLASEEANSLQIYAALGSEHMITNYRRVLTSLYKCEVVVFFKASTIACLALDILLREQGRNIEVMDFDPQLKELLQSKEVENAKREYLKRCSMI